MRRLGDLGRNPTVDNSGGRRIVIGGTDCTDTIRALVDQATALSPAQRDQIAAIFRPTDREASAFQPAPPRPRVTERTALYRHFDADGALLYVGIARSVETRTKRHTVASTWSQWVARSEAEWFPTRSAAEEAEATVIRAEHPIFNHQHNDTPEARGRAVAYLVQRGRLDLLLPALDRG